MNGQAIRYGSSVITSAPKLSTGMIYNKSGELVPKLPKRPQPVHTKGSSNLAPLSSSPNISTANTSYQNNHSSSLNCGCCDSPCTFLQCGSLCESILECFCSLLGNC